MNSDSVLFSLLSAAKGESVLHACSSRAAAADAFRQCMELSKRGVLAVDMEFNHSAHQVRFPGRGWVKFVDDVDGTLQGFRVEKIVYDDGRDA